MHTRDLTTADAETVTALYGEYEWWEDRTEVDVRRALAETEVAVGVEDDDLVAAARVLTDYTYYANVFGVVVVADRRWEGLGHEVMAALRDHPDLQAVAGLSLLCRRGLVPFYETVGFELFDPHINIPEGGTEELVRMTDEQDDGPEKRL